MMKVKILNVLEELVDGYKTVLEVDNEKIITRWYGDKPVTNKNYDVEIDIDEKFILNTNICLTSKHVNSIIQNDDYIKVIAKLDYDYETNLAILNMYDSIVLIEVEGIEKDMSKEWVEIQFSSMKIFNTNN